MIRFINLIRKKARLLFFAFLTLLAFVNVNMKYPVKSYDHIKREAILDQLFVGYSGNRTEALGDCEYEAVVEDDGAMSPEAAEGDLPPGHGVQLGGEYVPEDCKPMFSSAIIVPYRDQPEQLHGFLMYMHTFLIRQQLHYQIFVVEQIDILPFNRGTLLNIGAQAAISAGFPCLILHDIDLLPLRPANIYACSELPRHMSCAINQHRFLLKYLTTFSGVVAIRSVHFVGVNGLSNRFFGCGEDDDDLYCRLQARKHGICRFGPDISMYHMVYQPPYSQCTHNDPVLCSTPNGQMKEDGLNSLRHTEVETVMHPLFTHIVVDLTTQF